MLQLRHVIRLSFTTGLFELVFRISTLESRMSALILIIEDEPQIARLARDYLERPSWNWLQNEAIWVMGNQKKPTVCMNRYHSAGAMLVRVASPPV